MYPVLAKHAESKPSGKQCDNTDSRVITSQNQQGVSDSTRSSTTINCTNFMGNIYNIDSATVHARDVIHAYYDNRGRATGIQLGSYSQNEEHYIQKGYATRIFKHIMENVSHGAQVLELGFHTGRNILAFGRARPDIQFFGADIQEDLVDMVADKAKAENLRNIHALKMDFIEATDRFENGSFSLIYAGDGVFCHLDSIQVKKTMRLLSSKVKDDGDMIFSVNTPRKSTVDLMKINEIADDQKKLNGLFPHYHQEFIESLDGFDTISITQYKTGEKRVGSYPERDTFWYHFRKNA